MDPVPKDSWFAFAGQALLTRYRNTLAFFGTTSVVFVSAAIVCGFKDLHTLSYIFAGTAAVSVLAVVFKKSGDLIRDQKIILEELREQQFGTKEHPLQPEQAEAEPRRKHAPLSLPERERSETLEPSASKEREKVPLPRTSRTEDKK